MRQEQRTLMLPPEVTDVASLTQFLARDLPVTDVLASILWNASPITDAMVQQWKAAAVPMTLTLTIDSVVVAGEPATAAQVSQLIEQAAGLPDDHPSANLLRIIHETLRSVGNRDLDGQLSAAEARHQRFRLLDESQFSPRLLWPNAASPSGVVVQYSTMQDKPLIFLFRDAPAPTTAVSPTLLIARTSAQTVARILAPVVAPADAIEPLLDRARPEALLLLRRLTRDHVAVLETAGRLYIFSIDLFICIYTGQLREESGTPFTPFFSLHRRAMERMGTEDWRRPAVLLYYIYLIYVLWQGTCFGMSDLVPDAPAAGVDALDHIQHFIVTRILRLFYVTSLPPPTPAATTTTSLLALLDDAMPLVVQMSHQTMTTPRDPTLSRKHLLFNNEKTWWFRQFKAGVTHTGYENMDLFVRHADAGNILLSFVNAHWNTSRVKLALRFTPDDAADSKSPSAERKVRTVLLFNPEAPHVVQKTRLLFDSEYDRVLLAADGGSSAEVHAVDDPRIIVVSDEERELRVVNHARRAFEPSTRFTNAFYDEVRSFMQRTEARLTAERTATEAIERRVADLATQAAEERAGRIAADRRLDTRMDALERNLQLLLDRRVMGDRDVQQLYDVMDVPGDPDVPIVQELQSVMQDTASEFVGQLAARDTAQTSELRDAMRMGMTVLKTMWVASTTLVVMAVSHGVLPQVLTMMRDANAVSGTIWQIARPAGSAAVRKLPAAWADTREVAGLLRSDARVAWRITKKFARQIRRDVNFKLDDVAPETTTAAVVPRQLTPIDVTRSSTLADTAVTYLKGASSGMSAFLMVLSQSADVPQETVSLPTEWVEVGQVRDTNLGRSDATLLQQGSEYSFFFYNDNRRRMLRPNRPIPRGTIVSLYRVDESRSGTLGRYLVHTTQSRTPVAVVLHRRRWTTDVFFENGAHDDALDYTEDYYIDRANRIHIVLPNAIVGRDDAVVNAFSSQPPPSLPPAAPPVPTTSPFVHVSTEPPDPRESPQEEHIDVTDDDDEEEDVLLREQQRHGILNQQWDGKKNKK